MNSLALKHQKVQKNCYWDSFFFNSLKYCCLILCLKAFRLFEEVFKFLTSCLNCSKVRDQHKIKLFVNS